MTPTKLTRALALVAAGITGSGLALASVPAHATTADHGAGPSVHAALGHSVYRMRHLSPSKLARVRARERLLAAQHGSAPVFAKAGSKTFTVNTTEDSPLADPAGITCVDAATGTCSLRAAVAAANNLVVAVRIVLGPETYTLTTGSTLVVTDSKGILIVGRGAGKTAIQGDGSGIFDVTSIDPSVRAGGLFLTSLKLENGTSVQGGAVRLEGAGVTLTLDHVTATHNTAASIGGAIFSGRSASISIDHSRFTHNQASGGGALFEFWSAVLISDSSFEDNSAVGGGSQGGAIFNYLGVFAMSGGSITGNTAGDAGTAGQGGAIYDAALTTLTRVHVDGNTAEGNGQGGAIYGGFDALEIDHGTVSHNHANGDAGSGGGVYTTQATLAAHGVTMAGNRADGAGEGAGGGAIFAYGSGSPTQLIIDDGSKISGSNGSAVYLYNDGGLDARISGSTLTHNASTAYNGFSGFGCGGAVCAYAHQKDGLNLAMRADHITENSSLGSWGAGAVTTYAAAQAAASVTLRKNTFSHNRSGADGLGGAAGFFTSSPASPISVRMALNAFTANRAGVRGPESTAGDGGAVGAESTVTITDKGSVFSRNHAIGDDAAGGAIYDFGFYGSATFTRSTFTGNSAGTDDAANLGYGGAVMTDAGAGTVLDRVTMSGNSAAGSGGALYSDSDGFLVKVTASTISDNTAGTSARQGYGGALFISGGTAVIENSTLTGNRATSIAGSPGYGGAVFYQGLRLAVDYTTVSGNYARQGGGIYGGAIGTVVGSIVSGNRTSLRGSEQDCGVANVVFRLVSAGGNVLGQKTCVVTLHKSDKVSKNPRLGKLKNNGGPTKTMAISATSPAAGRATYLVPAADQRGRGRPSHHADAGAFEFTELKEHHH